VRQRQQTNHRWSIGSALWARKMIVLDVELELFTGLVLALRIPAEPARHLFCGSVACDSSAHR